MSVGEASVPMTQTEQPGYMPTEGSLAGDAVNQAPSPLRPVVEQWLNKIQMAKRAKSGWNDIADDCMQFYSAGTGFMWEPQYRAKFNQSEYGAVVPRFPMTIAKAFELVAIFGPTMYATNPVRTCTPELPMDINPAAFGDPNDPQVTQQLQQLGFVEGQRQLADETRAKLMERYLNYTPNEIPGGGLKQQAENAITEALVKGRGLLWTELWTPPGSSNPIVGSFYDTVDNLFIDPDAETIEDCNWVCRRVTEPRWKVERRYELPEGTLRSVGDYEGNYGSDETRDDSRDYDERRRHHSTDQITYYKIWSKMGLGARLQGMNRGQTGGDDLVKTMDKVLGDFVYLVVAEGVPYPLNMPTHVLTNEQDDVIVDKLSWPIPFYTDDRWPFVHLDFYRKPRDAWPIAPMAPGLGELKFINVMTSHLANRIWTSCRDFIAVAKSCAEDIKSQLEEGRDQAFLEVSDSEGGIDNVVKFLQQPQTNMDTWKILDYVFQLFDKRTGLSEILYGVQQSQSRSATDSNVKRQSVSIRPDYMSDKCEDFLTDVARHEALAVRWLLEAKNVAPVIGQAGAILWEKYISSEPLEKTVREIDYRVEHGTARKPDRERDSNNINQAMQIFGPIAQQYWQMSGDPGPMNYLTKQWGKISGFDTRGLIFQPPPPPPEEQQGPPPGAEREQAQVETEKARAENERGRGGRDQQSAAGAEDDRKQGGRRSEEDHRSRMSDATIERIIKVRAADADNERRNRESDARVKSSRARSNGSK